MSRKFKPGDFVTHKLGFFILSYYQDWGNSYTGAYKRHKIQIKGPVLVTDKKRWWFGWSYKVVADYPHYQNCLCYGWFKEHELDFHHGDDFEKALAELTS